MKIDLHIHSKDCSDGKMTLEEIFKSAHERRIDLISICDHDSIDCQEKAESLAKKYGMYYIYGTELNISFAHPDYKGGKAVSLDMLGYQYDIYDEQLKGKLEQLREYRTFRAEKILENLNEEFKKENMPLFTHQDLEAIQENVDGSLGRPHIANYLLDRGIVSTRQEAFDRYLVKCNVPKMPVSLEEASSLIRDAGGKLIFAHPNDPNGTSLVSLTKSLPEQQQIIKDSMLPYLDGIECWHSRHDSETISSYLAFAKKEHLMITGGSDCHQQPVIMGTVDVPDWVARQFGI